MAECSISIDWIYFVALISMLGGWTCLSLSCGYLDSVKNQDQVWLQWMYSISSKVIFPSTFTPKKMDRWLYPFIMLTVSEVLMLWRLSTIWFETTVCDCNLYQSPTGHVYCSLRSASMHQATNSITRKPHNGEQHRFISWRIFTFSVYSYFTRL